MTPKGIETFSIFKPLGLSHLSKILPIGSSNLDISSRPSHIDFILFSSNTSLSRVAEVNLSLFSSTSFLFSSIIIEELCCKFSEAAFKISFFNFGSNSETTLDASFAFFPIFRISLLSIFFI